MKLTMQVRSFPAGDFVVLCDEHGEPLPGQMGSRLETRVGRLPRLTVDFVIDDEAIIMVTSA